MSNRTRRAFGALGTLAALVLTGLVLSTLSCCAGDSAAVEVATIEEVVEEVVERPEIEEFDFEARVDALESLSELDRDALEAEHAAAEEASKADDRRRAKRGRELAYILGKSPAAIREELWAVPEKGGSEAVSEALLRVCISEAGWRAHEDCAWIWQVAQNIRSRSCVKGTYRRITECEDGVETSLSALRRLSGSILGAKAPRNARQRWIAKLKLDCEYPEGFTPSEGVWYAQRKRHCDKLASLVREISLQKADRDLTGGYIPIAWGGRCERVEGACDDAHACKRGLVRIASDTQNAFWRRPVYDGEVDPVCGG